MDLPRAAGAGRVGAGLTLAFSLGPDPVDGGWRFSRERLAELLDVSIPTLLGVGIEYISSAGLGVFMSYIEEFKEKNFKMVIFGMKDKVFNTFNILGLDELLTIVATREDAKKKLSEV